jgi:hypothetical protein
MKKYILDVHSRRDKHWVWEEEVKAKEGQGEGSSIRDRLPGLFNRNAVPGGKNGGNGNGRATN